MNIAINTDPKTIQQLNSLNQGVFAPVIDGSTEAIVFVRDQLGFSLQSAVAAGVPVVVIAGAKDAEGKKLIAQAKDLLIPPACILIKEENQTKTLDGIDLGKSYGGIGIRAILKAVRYAVENGLVPDILVWQENKPPKQEFHDKREPSVATEVSKPVAPVSQEPKDTVRVPRTYAEFTGLYDYVFCLVMDTDGSRQIKDLAEALNAVHVDCGDNISAKLYGDYTSNMAYAFEQDKLIMMPGRTRKAVVQASLANLDINDLEMFLKHAKFVIHVTSGSKINATKEWLDSGYKLDAVISDEADKCRAVLGNRVPVSDKSSEISKFLEGF